MNKWKLAMIASACAGLAVCACYDPDPISPADAASDSDADTDADTGHCTEDCPDDSGFPCPCPSLMCAGDGSICGSLSITESDVGVCLSPCEVDADCTTELDCNAIPRCVMILESESDTDSESDEATYCGYVCGDNSDCPVNMMCAEVSGSLNICYPVQD